jgi:hypothetical protein
MSQPSNGITSEVTRNVVPRCHLLNAKFATLPRRRRRPPSTPRQPGRKLPATWPTNRNRRSVDRCRQALAMTVWQVCGSST